MMSRERYVKSLLFAVFISTPRFYYSIYNFTSISIVSLISIVIYFSSHISFSAKKKCPIPFSRFFNGITTGKGGNLRNKPSVSCIYICYVNGKRFSWLFKVVEPLLFATILKTKSHYPHSNLSSYMQTASDD